MELIIIEGLQIHPQDIKSVNHREAEEYAAQLGEGWRLPTIKEYLEILGPNQHDIPDIELRHIYWSSTHSQHDENFKIFFFRRIESGDAHETIRTNARAVRDFTGEVALGMLLKEF